MAEPGQFWRLWVFDDSYCETFVIEKISDDIVYGITINGEQCAVDLSRLVDKGEQIEPPTFYGRELKL